MSFLEQCRGWIFDIDGTIMDSHEGHFRAWDRTTRAHGREYSHAEITAQFGKTTYKIAEALLPHLSDAELRQVSKEKAGYFLKEIPNLSLFSGTISLFERIKASGGKICLASSNVRVVIDRVIEANALAALVDGYIGLDDITHGKPDPEMITKSGAILDLPPSDCVVIGDSIYDLEAGKRAGCKTVGVLTGGVFSKDQLAQQEPDLIVNEVGELINYIPR